MNPSITVSTTSGSTPLSTPQITRSTNTSQDKAAEQKEEKNSYRTAHLEKRAINNIPSETKQINALLQSNNYKEAAVLLKLEMLKGDIHAAFMLGELYEQGRGVNKDPDQAATLYRLAIWQKLPKAESKVKEAKTTTLKECSCAEKQWYINYFRLLMDANLALTEGSISRSKIDYAAGEKYRIGVQDKKADLKKAKAAYDAALQSADDDETLYLLGKRYLEDKQIQDLSKAVQCFQMAAANGHVKALTRLKICYQEGLGVAVNEDIANNLSELASKIQSWGDAENFDLLYLTQDIQTGETLLNLGHHFFLQKDPTGDDFKKAVEFYELAVEKGKW